MVLTFYYFQVLCTKEEVSCTHEYSRSDGLTLLVKFRVGALLGINLTHINRSGSQPELYDYFIYTMEEALRSKPYYADFTDFR